MFQTLDLHVPTQTKVKIPTFSTYLFYAKNKSFHIQRPNLLFHLEPLLCTWICIVLRKQTEFTKINWHQADRKKSEAKRHVILSSSAAYSRVSSISRVLDKHSPGQRNDESRFFLFRNVTEQLSLLAGEISIGGCQII